MSLATEEFDSLEGSKQERVLDWTVRTSRFCDVLTMRVIAKAWFQGAIDTQWVRLAGK